MSINFETDTLGLDHMQGLDIISQLKIFLRLFEKVGKELVRSKRSRDPLSSRI
jgi:hypothetical protein